MNGFRNLSEQETIRLAELGNRADDWHWVVVTDDFAPDTITGCRFRGDVAIGSRAVIEDSAIENYEIGDGTVIPQRNRARMPPPFDIRQRHGGGDRQ